MTSEDLQTELDRIEREIVRRGWATAGSNVLDAAPRSKFLGWMISAEAWPDVWRIVETPADAELRAALAKAAS